jgi:hypothetical protein
LQLADSKLNIRDSNAIMKEVYKLGYGLGSASSHSKHKSKTRAYKVDGAKSRV